VTETHFYKKNKQNRQETPKYLLNKNFERKKKKKEKKGRLTLHALLILTLMHTLDSFPYS
jgi:hypothetical protein